MKDEPSGDHLRFNEFIMSGVYNHVCAKFLGRHAEIFHLKSQNFILPVVLKGKVRGSSDSVDVILEGTSVQISPCSYDISVWTEVDGQT